MAGFFLNFNHFGTDVIQEFNGKILSPLVGDVVLVVGEVADHFIDTVDANGREVIAQRTEVAFGEREQAVVNQSLNNFAFDFQRCAGNVHQLVNTGKQAGFVTFINITQTGTVEGNNTDGTGLFGRTEQAVAAGKKFTQI